MNKYTVVAIILLIIVGFLYIQPRKNTVKAPANQEISISKSLNLPSGWVTVSESDSFNKLEKSVRSGLKPQIVFKKTISKDALTPAKYADQVKNGAKSALSSLVYLTDKRNSSESGYSAFFTGYYFSGDQKIYIDQRLFIRGETVYTLTGSFESGLDEEVAQVLTSLSKEKTGQ
jgi:hypothetical protein